MSQELFTEINRQADQLIKYCQQLKSERSELKKKIDKLTEELEGLKEQALVKDREIEAFRRERRLIASRVERIRENLVRLERPTKEKAG